MDYTGRRRFLIDLKAVDAAYERGKREQHIPLSYIFTVEVKDVLVSVSI